MRLPTIRRGLFRFLGYGGLVFGGVAGVNLSPTIESVALSWQVVVIGIALAGGAICTAVGRLLERDRPQQLGQMTLAFGLFWILTILLLSTNWATLLFASICWALACFLVDRAIQIDTDARDRIALQQRLNLPNGEDES
jgi:hypothetical protein